MVMRIRKKQMDILQKTEEKQQAISQSHQYYEHVRRLDQSPLSRKTSYLHRSHSLISCQIGKPPPSTVQRTSNHAATEHEVTQLEWNVSVLIQLSLDSSSLPTIDNTIAPSSTPNALTMKMRTQLRRRTVRQAMVTKVAGTALTTELLSSAI